jgi:hypothetical protein
MFSRFLGKGEKSGNASKTEAVDSRGLEVNEDDPDSIWSMWDSALAEQDSRFSALPPDEPAAPAAAQRSPSPLAAAPTPDSAYEVPTLPMCLEPKTPDQRKDEAIAIVELHHHRIANTIRTLWGYKECGAYINKLIMSGGDGMGHARIGFNQDAVTAMMALSDLHEAQFGAEEMGTGMGFDGRSGFAGLAKSR